jgi:hypothetical protein
MVRSPNHARPKSNGWCVARIAFAKIVQTMWRLLCEVKVGMVGAVEEMNARG